MGELLASLLIFLALLAPPGYLLLHLAGRPVRGIDLGTSLGIGYSVILPVFLLERALGGPWLVLPVVGGCVAWLYRSGALAGFSDRSSWRLLPLPLTLGALAVAVNAFDMKEGADGGLVFRLGFDVSDRVFYTMVSEELLRATPPRLFNPAYAAFPLQYSLFPGLAGALLQTYAGVPILRVGLVHMPAIGMVFTGLAAASLLDELGIRSASARALTTLVVALGGDFSFLVDASGGWLERTRHFFAFHSFAAESLYYNTWMLGLPIVLVVLRLGHGWLSRGTTGELALAAFVLGTLWETKVFALFVLVLGSAVAAGLTRQRRLIGLAGLSAVVAIPWVALTLSTGASRLGSPLLLSPLHHLSVSVAANSALAAIDRALAGSVSPWLAMLVLGAAFLAGALGVRIVGLPRLWREARSDPTGFYAWLAAAILLGIGLSLLVVGNPVPMDGVQFLTLALYLSAIPVGLELGGWIGSPRPAARAMACLLAGVAVASPWAYVGRKVFRDRLTSAGANDRASLAISPDAVRACRWVAARTPATDRLMVPLEGLDPRDNVRGFFLGAVCSRRLVAAPGGGFLVEPGEAERQRSAVRRAYDAWDASEAEQVLRALEARWVWEDAERPLRFRSPLLTLAFASGGVRIYRFEGAGPERSEGAH